MNCKPLVAIFVVATLPSLALAEKPSKAEVVKVVQTIMADKAKVKIYCDQAKLVHDHRHPPPRERSARREPDGGGDISGDRAADPAPRLRKFTFAASAGQPPRHQQCRASGNAPGSCRRRSSAQGARNSSRSS
jgi:hypothetical protein